MSYEAFSTSFVIVSRAWYQQYTIVKQFTLEPPGRTSLRMQTSSFGNAKDSGKPYQRHVDVHVSISVVVNKWKDENDKLMTFRQWLDFCRVENSTRISWDLGE
ncbi:hypothetical protein C5167_047733 [Papaver somniferum]|uniref:Uncharacterized protein n=1 Tax=Papaver somniferum TaxID=3469 RepID=A0A4Y7LHI0_PAPSO|nr:hypothetical protein C5167_047733 [Papaver somniferum]